MRLRLNPVTWGDLRARLASSKVLWVLRLYLASLAVVAFFILPPEGGRLPVVGEGDLAELFLAFQLAWIVYLASAFAVGEIAPEGEKGVLDLAATSFSPRTIAAGKAGTALLSAVGLVVLGLPLVLLTAEPSTLGAALRTTAVTVPLAGALGILAAWLSAIVASDLLRTLLHWTVLLAVFALTRWLPAPLDLVSPLRLIAAAYDGVEAAWLLALLPHLAVGGLGWLGVTRAVTVWRREVTA